MAFGDDLSYAGVPLQIIGGKGISRKFVLTEDRTTYLWTEWVFDLLTQLNPATISYGPNGTLAGQPPATTDQYIRTILNRPRQSLIFRQNGNLVLQTPVPPQITDCQNGPVVEDFDVKQDVAAHTWIVKLRIVAKVRECSNFQNGIPLTPLISNRWRRVMRHDEDYLGYVQTFGECHFDTGMLTQSGTWPDRYRLDLMQPTPTNCKRDDIEVIQLSDGCTYQYNFKDQERFFNQNTFGGKAQGTRIELYQTEFYSQKSLAGAIVGQGLQAVPNIMGHAGNLDIGGAVGDFAHGAFNVVQEQIPKYYSHILCRVWGGRNSAKVNQVNPIPGPDLLGQALSMAFERININNELYSTELIVSMDRVGKMVEVQLTKRSGPEQLALQAANQAAQQFGNGLNLVNQVFQNLGFAQIQNLPQGPLPQLPTGQELIELRFADSENSPGNWYTQDPTIPNLPPPNSRGTRGTLLCQVIAEALNSPCQTPIQPPQDPTLVTADVRLYGN